MKSGLKKNKPNFFIVTRMFSGLFETFQEEKWKPSGIPAITNLVERISKLWRVTWIISCKNATETSIVNANSNQIKVKNFRMNLVRFPNSIRSGKANSILSDILTISRCYRLSSNVDNKIFYFDRSNIVSAAFVKLFLRVPVVVRILGIYPDQKALATRFKSKLFSPLTFLAYKVKYDLVICSQDGSGGEYYIAKLFSGKTPKKLLLNGVEKISSHREVIKDERISLLFVGKLIQDKGIVELIDAITALKEKGKIFHLKIVGKGVLLRRIVDTINARHLQNYVEVVGSVEHNKMNQYYADTDVYISLNKLGNLSNSVLEAMSAGKCIIMLNKDSNTSTDEYTEEIIPVDNVIRVDRSNIVSDLIENLSNLCDNPIKVNEYSERMRKFTDSFLWSWDARIGYEIELLRKVVKREIMPG